MKEILINSEHEPYFDPLPRLPINNSPIRPFFIVHPSASGKIAVVREGIKVASLKLEEELKTDKFELFARYIYPVRVDQPHSYLWLMTLRLLYSPDHNVSHAFVFSREHLEDLALLDKVKRIIRNNIGTDYYQATYRNSKYNLDLHHLHAPDEDELDSQYNALMRFYNPV